MIMSLISSLLHAEFEKFVGVGVSYNHLQWFLKQIKVTTECNLVCVFKAYLRISTMDRNTRSDGGQDFCSSFLMFFSPVFSEDVTLITHSFLNWAELMTLLQLICDPVK